VIHGLPPSQAIQDTGWNRLDLLAGGNRLAGTASPLLGEKIRRLVDELVSQYDVLLLQGTPWSSSGMAAVLPHVTSAVCLLLEKEQVDQSAEARCLETLRAQRVRVVGAVVTAHAGV
jgi:hypothetical protein